MTGVFSYNADKKVSNFKLVSEYRISLIRFRRYRCLFSASTIRERHLFEEISSFVAKLLSPALISMGGKKLRPDH